MNSISPEGMDPRDSFSRYERINVEPLFLDYDEPHTGRVVEKEHKKKHKKHKKKHRRHEAEGSEDLGGTYPMDNPAFRPENAPTGVTQEISEPKPKLPIINSQQHKVTFDRTDLSPEKPQLQHREPFLTKPPLNTRQSTLESARLNPDVKDFIKENFEMRHCCKYVPNANQENMCYCNRDPEWHKNRGISTQVSATGPKIKWSIANGCSALEPTTCYGKLKLQGFGRMRVSHKPKFIRLDSECKDFEPLWELFTNKKYWGIPVPDLILSINGGAKKMQPLSSKMLKKIKNGLISVSTGVKSTWIITPGFNLGCCQLVGQAIQEYTLAGGDERNLYVIGICTWGAVYNNECLDPEAGHTDHLTPEYETPQDRFKLFEYFNITSNPGRGQAVIEPNHTHFIFCDDGSHRVFGKELQFRADFERFLVSKLKERREIDNRAFSAPVVQVVIEGGKKAILTAGYAAAAKTPIVTVKGSGRAADELAWARTLRVDHKISDDEAKTKILRMLDSYDETWKCTPKEKKEMTEILFQMGVKDPTADFDCDLISVFNAEYEDDLERTILYTFLKHPEYKDSTMTQVFLSMAWNRADIAAQEIFSESNKSHWKGMKLEYAMEEALMKQQKDFVELFLDHGISVHQFLTKCVLQRLYLKTFAGKTEAGERLLRRLERENVCSRLCLFSCCCKKRHERETYLDYLYATKLQDVHNTPIGEDYVLFAVNRLVEIYTDYAVDHIYTEDSLKNEIEYHNGQAPLEKNVFPPYSHTGERRFTFQDLYLWALLNHNVELAFLFWKHGKDQVGSALIASTMLKNMAKDAETAGEMELNDCLEKDAAFFEELAVGVMSNCNKKSKDLSRTLLIRSLPYWNHQTVMEIAETNECMDMLYQTSVQDVLTKTWNGGMDIDTPTWKVLLAILFPVFIPVIIFSTNLKRLKRDKASRKQIEAYDNERMMDSSRPNQAGDISMRKHLSDVERVNVDAPNAREYKEDLQFEGAIESLSRKSQREARLNKLAAQRSGFRNLPFWNCLALFYNAPRVKYILNLLSTVFFLLCYSYLILVQLHPFDYPCYVRYNDTYSVTMAPPPENLKDLWLIQPHWTEIYIFIWCITFIAEEVRQFFSRSQKLMKQLKEFSVWDWFDIVISIFMILCLILRLTLSCRQFDWVRNIYAVTLAMCFMRFMQFYYAHPTLGPKVVMIIHMVNDVIFFVCILIIFMLSYGVASLSLLTDFDSQYVNKEMSIITFKNIFFRPYWQMYGELFLQDDNETIMQKANGGERNWLVIILLAIYMLLSNVLLLNLLIAMFGYSFEKVQSISYKYFAYIRHDLIFEYYKRPILPPPLIFFSHVYRTIKWLSKGRCKNRVKLGPHKYNDFRMDLKLSEHQRLTAFEQQATDKYCKDTFLKDKNMHAQTFDKIEGLIEGLADRQNKSLEIHVDKESTNSVSVSTNPDYLSRLDKIEQKLEGLQSLQNKVDQMLMIMNRG